MYEQLKQKSLSTAPHLQGADQCVRQPQVVAAIESASYAVETLESAVNLLLARLEPVLDMSKDEARHGESPEPTLVPLAGSINSIGNRVATMARYLEVVLRALEI